MNKTELNVAIRAANFTKPQLAEKLNISRRTLHSRLTSSKPDEYFLDQLEELGIKIPNRLREVQPNQDLFKQITTKFEIENDALRAALELCQKENKRLVTQNELLMAICRNGLNLEIVKKELGKVKL